MKAFDHKLKQAVYNLRHSTDFGQVIEYFHEEKSKILEDIVIEPDIDAVRRMQGVLVWLNYLLYDIESACQKTDS